MIRIVKEIQDNCDLYVLGDTHIGSIACHEEGLKRVIDEIDANENALWIHMGDWISAITTDDKRYTTESVTEPIPLLQVKEAISLFERIAHKGIVGLFGNHEQKLHRFGNLTREICERLNIPYGTFSCRLILTKNGELVTRLFLTHGLWQFTSNAKDYVQKEANMLAQLKMRMQDILSDCYIMLCGHAHKLLLLPPTNLLTLRDSQDGLKQKYLKANQNDDYIQPELRWYGCTGCFERTLVDGVVTYAEMRGYPPTELGYLKIIIRKGIVQTIKKIKI